MPRNGAGTFVLPAGQPVVPNTVISSTVFNTLANDLANGLTTSIATDGQTPMTANLSMGNNRLINLDAGIGAQDAVNKTQLDDVVVDVEADIEAASAVLRNVIYDNICFKNLLINGSFAVSRGVASALVSASPTYTVLAKWFAYSTFNSHGSLASSYFPSIGRYVTTLVRTVGATNTSPLTLGHVVETLIAEKYKGKTVILSFYITKGSAYSGVGGLVDYNIATGTGTDQSSVLLMAGTWTGQINNTDTVDLSTTPAGTYIRVSKVITLPANCSEIGVTFSTRAAGTAVANDSISFYDIQLEEALPGATVPSKFERLPLQVDTMLAARYYQEITFTLRSYAAAGTATGSSISLPVTFRSTPAPIQSANDVLFTQVNCTATTSLYLANTNSVFVTRNATATGLIQFSETFKISAEL